MEEVRIDISPVKLSTLKKLVAATEAVVENDETELSFEYILMSLFPVCWNNIQEELKRQYTLGYIQGQNEKFENE